MNILILCRKDERPEYDQVSTYATALGVHPRNHTYGFAELEELVFSYDGSELKVTHRGKDVANYDGIFLIGWFKTKILEDIALSAALYADSKGLKIWNKEVLFTRSRSKLSQYVYAALGNVSMTPFLFCHDRRVLESSIDSWDYGYPVIVKGVQASRGNDNYKVDNVEQLKDIVNSSDPEEGPWFVIQSFVPNEGDYRIIVMGDAVRMIIHRQSNGETHLNNTSKGGMANTINVASIPDYVKDSCVRLAKALRRDITGVDMIKHSETGKYYLLEINNMPQLATGSFVQEKIKILDEYLGDANG